MEKSNKMNSNDVLDKTKSNETKSNETKSNEIKLMIASCNTRIIHSLIHLLYTAKASILFYILIVIRICHYFFSKIRSQFQL
jgi:hypothetical protein